MQQLIRGCIRKTPRLDFISFRPATSQRIVTTSRHMASKEGEGTTDGGAPSEDKSPTAESQSKSQSDRPTPSKSKTEASNISQQEGVQEKYATRGNLRTKMKKDVEQAREKFLSMDLDAKRKLYKCKAKYTTLSDVVTWPQYFAENLKNDPKAIKYSKVNKKKVEVEKREDLNKKLSLFRGDITTLEIDAIVNAANESLLGGGGVDGAIHSAAGPKLRSECETLNGCHAGDAKITCGYNLPAKYVIHTVGPRGENAEVLKNCYLKSLSLLKEHELKSIAFPCISTGIFGYPNAKAANVALSTIRQWLEKDEYASNVERIIMCLFLQVDVDVYHDLMQLYFPMDSVTNASNSSKLSDSEDAGGDEEAGKKEESAKEGDSSSDKK